MVGPKNPSKKVPMLVVPDPFQMAFFFLSNQLLYHVKKTLSSVLSTGKNQKNNLIIF